MKAENKVNENDIIEGVMEKYFPAEFYPHQLWESMRYCFFGGGKRVRPRLVYKACEAAGGDRAFTEPLMAALEMIHTYSLIHDDLPCMDDDDTRRGRPSCHKAYGETLAVLTGDALLNLAYETLIGGYAAAGDKENYIKAAQIIASAAGIYGMVGGQVADTQPQPERGADELEYVHSHKTGALIRAAVLAGGLSRALSVEEFNAFSDYGSALGMIFQITDDIIDINTAAASEEDKLTYPSFYGLEKSRMEVERLRGECHRALAVLGTRGAGLTAYADKLAERIG